jgi:hypothetical protein
LGGTARLRRKVGRTTDGRLGSTGFSLYVDLFLNISPELGRLASLKFVAAREETKI